MRLRILFLLLTILYLLNVVSSSSQETVWKPVEPGGNGWCMFWSMHPATGNLYCSTDMNYSLHRSTDQGDTWEPIANPITGTAFYIAGDPKEPNTLYMNQISSCPMEDTLRMERAKGSGIWKSIDNGDTWFQVCQTEEFGDNRGQSSVVDPVNNNIIYWTADDMGVRVSKDGGYTWEDKSTGLPKKNIRRGSYFYRQEFVLDQMEKEIFEPPGTAHTYALEIDHNSLPEKRIIYYPTNVGLYRMQEPDGEWELVEGGLPRGNCRDVEVCDRNIIYATITEHGLFRSLGAGKTWQELKNGLDGKMPYCVVATNSRPDIVYVTTMSDEGIYGSQDGGESFRLLTHRRFNSKYNWVTNYRHIEAVNGRTIFVDPNDPYTVILFRQRRTHDGGQTWHNYAMKEVRRDRWIGTGLTLLTDYRVVFDPNRPDLVWMGFSDTGLMLSEDRGESIINILEHHRREINPAAYWRHKLGGGTSCTTIAVDPDLSTTVYGTLCGKNALVRRTLSGIIIKTVDGGWNWEPVCEKNGLADGAIRSIIIDPSSPIHDRTVYVASFANGVYKSVDDGENFKSITNPNMFGGNTRIMWLEMAPSDPQILYLAVGGSFGIRPITFGPDCYPPLKTGMYGGVFKTVNGGKTWEKCNKTREIPSVQDIAVHPFNPDIAYAAAWQELYLVPENTEHPELRDGGVFKTTDGGETWERVFDAPNDEMIGKGQVDGVCINPVAPEIVYAAVERYGVFRSLDGGQSWSMVGKKYMERMQRRYHSIDLNPHDPAEVWLAHFGNGFTKGIDYEARELMQKKFLRANFVRNPGFEELNKNGLPLHWNIEQPPVPKGEKPVFSVSTDHIKDGKYSVRFHLTRAYVDAPSTIQGYRKQARLAKKGLMDPVSMRRDRGPTSTWIYQKINPYFTSLMRGRNIAVEVDVFIVDRDRPSNRDEVPRDPPQVYLSEARDYNIQYMVAENSLEDSVPVYGKPVSDMNGQWIHCRAIGRVSEDANWLRVTVTGVGHRSERMDIYVDNIRLGLVE